MRNYIFKNELEFLFLKHKVKSKEQIRTKEHLFIKTSVSDRGKILFLKNNFQFLNELKSIISEEKFIKDFLEMISLDDDLYMPEGLKQKIIGNEKVAVFVGAGVSKLLKYPLWGELAEKAIDFLRDENQIDDFQSSRLKNDVKDPKQKLSILETFFNKQSEKRSEFYKKHFLNVEKTNKVDDGKINPYDILVDPVFNWIKLTSNVDLAFKDSLKKELLINNENLDENEILKYDDEDLLEYGSLNFDKLHPDKIYHLHGVITKPSSIIFTTLDYIETYYHENSDTQKFLKELFENYSVVFIGYGLEELQILESVVNRGSPKIRRHYALFGAYFNEINFFNIRKQYFSESLNIELQHYYLDIDRYERLTEVLKSWRNQIEYARGENFHDKVELIDDVLNGTH